MNRRAPLSLAFFALSVALASADSSRLMSSADAVRYAKVIERIGSDKAPSIGDLETAIKIYADDGDVWRSLAVARLQAKQFQPAIAGYLKAIELGGFDNQFRAGCEYDIACAYSLDGDKEAAFHWLEISLDHGFRDLEHVRTDKDLERLHSDKRWEKLAATADVTKMDRNAAWRYDLWLLNRELRRIHFDPYRVTPREAMDAYTKALDKDIPKLNDNEIKVRMMKFARMLGDGHTRVRPAHGASGVPALPLQLYWFEDGLFVTAAHPSIADLAGAEVLEIAGKPFDSLVPTLSEIIFRDNYQGVRSAAPSLATYPAVLNGFGLLPETDVIPIKVRDAAGSVRSVNVKALTGASPDATWATPRDSAPDKQPLYLKNRQKPYWYEYLPDRKLVYFQYNSVRNDADAPTDKFAKEMFKFINENDVEGLVVDARWNGGGNSFLNRPFVNGIIGCEKINKPGALFIVIGRQTFSAAQNFVTDLGRACEPIYVGEPTGSSPNFVGETVRGSLPYSKLDFTVSDLYWQRSWPMDYRTWIAPQLPAPPTFEAYKANRDPALEAVFAYLDAKRL